MYRALSELGAGDPGGPVGVGSQIVRVRTCVRFGMQEGTPSFGGLTWILGRSSLERWDRLVMPATGTDKRVSIHVLCVC